MDGFKKNNDFDPIMGTQETLESDIQGLMHDVKEKRIFERAYVNHPYLVLGAAAAGGYVLAGGFFTPFTRRLLRMSIRGVLLPLAVAKAADFTTDDL